MACRGLETAIKKPKVTLGASYGRQGPGKPSPMGKQQTLYQGKGWLREPEQSACHASGPGRLKSVPADQSMDKT
jgi:hypothetical protein